MYAKCEHDSGSMTGFAPLCAGPATHLVTYHDGSSGPIRIMVCARHVHVAEARAFPGHDSTVALCLVLS